MLKKFLKEVVVIAVGRPVEEIVDLLDSKKHVNEFLIAKKMDITINQARNILYKLSDNGLVSSIRKKDKRKGWYTYFWKIEIFKSLEFLRNTLKKRIDQLQHQIKSREIKQFYICERCNIEFNEENALLHDFTCNECGNIFSMRDNTKILREFKKNLNKLEKELYFVEEEIKKEKEKLDKIKLKEIKKEEKLRLEKKKAMKKKKIKKPIKKIIKKKSKVKKKIKKKSKIKKIKKKTKKKRK
jgi:transcription factor E|tara:strand:+ start:1406 stop:2128 length:723 start_codon:yes stop_codon:yes gene_type:complete